MAFPHLWRMNRHPGLVPVVLPWDDATPTSMAFIDGHLRLGLAVEDEATAETRRVTEDDLTSWGATLEQLLPLAVENLRRRSDATNWETVDTVPGMEVYVARDGDASSRMLVLADLIATWPLEGVLVAAPSTEQLLVIRMDDLSCLDAISVMVMANHFAHGIGDNPLSDQLFWFDGQHWSHLQVTVDDEQVRLHPPEGFLEAMERLVAMNFVRAAAEA